MARGTARCEHERARQLDHRPLPAMTQTRQRGWVRKRANGWQACWREGDRQRTGPRLFERKAEPPGWLPEYLRSANSPAPDLTFSQHVERFLRLHAAAVEASTIRTLAERLGATSVQATSRRSYQTALEAFGDVRLRDLERMSLELAEWQATLPKRYRYAVMRSLRQVLNAAVRWQLMRENPANRVGSNPQPKAKEVPIFSSLMSVDRLAAELSPRSARIPVFAAETGLRPSGWAALESCHVDWRDEVVKVRQSVVDRRLKTYGKTSRSRRDVPLTARALTALPSGALKNSDLLFSAVSGTYIDFDNWRRREWRPGVDASGLDRRLTPYAMRHTYASFALDAGVSIFELARLMGTSVRVIDSTYGHLVRGSLDRVRAALEARAQREFGDAA